MPPRSYSQTQQGLNPNQHNSVHQADVTGGIIALVLVLAYPSILVGIILYRKSRAVIRRRQIETLEKLWHLSSKK